MKFNPLACHPRSVLAEIHMSPPHWIFFRLRRTDMTARPLARIGKKTFAGGICKIAKVDASA
jgi:hypothetical protein